MASKKSTKRAPRKASKSGRPTKLNAATQQKICDAILVGATYEAAAQFAGVSYDAFNEWMKRDEEDFRQFRQSVEVANASAQVYFATNIKTAASNGDWRAAAWMLERRFAKAYGLRVGAIDEKELDDAIESELARIAAAR